MQETQEIWVQSLGQEDPLEEKMATYSSKWQRYWSKNPMDREAWRTAVLGVAKSQTQLSMHTHTHTWTGGRGNEEWLLNGWKSFCFGWWKIVHLKLVKMACFYVICIFSQLKAEFRPSYIRCPQTDSVLTPVLDYQWLSKFMTSESCPSLPLP